MPDLALDLAGEGGGCMRVILAKASVTGVVSLDELLQCLASRGIKDTDQVEDIRMLLQDMGFSII